MQEVAREGTVEGEKGSKDKSLFFICNSTLEESHLPTLLTPPPAPNLVKVSYMKYSITIDGDETCKQLDLVQERV